MAKKTAEPHTRLTLADKAVQHCSKEGLSGKPFEDGCLNFLEAHNADAKDYAELQDILGIHSQCCA